MFDPFPQWVFSPTILHNLLLSFIFRRSRFFLYLDLCQHCLSISWPRFLFAFFPILFFSSKNDLQLKLFYRVFFEFMHCCSLEKNICFFCSYFQNFDWIWKKLIMKEKNNMKIINKNYFVVKSLYVWHSFYSNRPIYISTDSSFLWLKLWFIPLFFLFGTISIL